MNRRILAAVTVAGLVLVGGGGAWAWRVHVREQVLAQAVPARPDLGAARPELATRVAACERALRAGEGGAGRLAELAQLYHANGFATEAAQCYRGLLRAEPDNPRWPHRLAVIYADFGQAEDALGLWRRAIRLAPAYVPARIRAGDMLVKLNRPAEAAEMYLDALEREPGNPFALVGLGRIDFDAGRLSQARARLEEAARRSRDAIGTDLLATVAAAQGETGVAEGLRGRGKSSGSYYDLPDPWLEEILADCYDAYRLSVSGGFAVHRGDPATGRRLMEQALRLEPTNALTHFQLGLLDLDERNPAGALGHFTASVAAMPAFPEAWAQVIKLRQDAGDAAGARQALGAALAANPQSGGLHLLRARELAAAGRTDEAVAEYRVATTLETHDGGPWIELAKLAFARDRMEEAVAALRSALAAEPEFPPALTILAVYSIRTGDEAGARAWLQRARRQVRISRPEWDALAAQFRERFGAEP